MRVVSGREINAQDPTLESIGTINQSYFLWTVDLQTGKRTAYEHNAIQRYQTCAISSLDLQISFTYTTAGENMSVFASRECYYQRS